MSRGHVFLVAGLIVSTILAVLFVGVALHLEAVVNALASGNNETARSLFAHALSEKRIDIYVRSDAQPTNFPLSGYTVSLIPIRASHGEVLPPGAENFIAHNNSCAAEYACYLWESDRSSSIFLLGLLRNVDRNANELLSDLKDDGRLSEQGEEHLRGLAFQHEVLLKDFGLQWKPNKASDAIGADWLNPHR